MKRIKIILIAILASIQIYAQEKPTIAIQINYENTLYVNFNNYVTISVEGVSHKDLSISLNQGTIKKNEQGFIIRPSKIGYIELKIISKGDLIDLQYFKVTNLPDPKIFVGQLSGGIVVKKDLLSVAMISIEFDNLYLDSLFTIEEFSISANLNGKKEEHKATGNKFNMQQIQFINRTQAGELKIGNLKIKNTDGKILNTKSVAVFKINDAFVSVFNKEKETDGNIKLSEFVNKEIKLKIKNSLTDSNTDRFSIKNFELSYSEKGENKKLISYTGDFTPEMINAVKTTGTNLFIIKNIAVVDNESRKIQYVQEITFFITERDL